jgi:hypothetical protein
LRDEKASRTPNTTQSSTGTVSTIVTQSTADSTGRRRRRTEKVPNTAKCMHKHETEITLSFN